jgi:hypothetical protein
MYKFTAHEWFTFRGRGGLAQINEFLPEGMWNPNDLVGETVLIDDKEYEVTGVEKFAIAYSKSNPYKLRFCLLVKEYYG